MNNALPKEQEWEVRFQPPVQNVLNYAADTVETSVKTDELLCDIQGTSKDNMLNVSEFTIAAEGQRTDPIATAAGIALTGTYIYNSLAVGNTDAIDEEIKSMDSCLNHPTGTGALHYHFWSPCIKPGFGFASTTDAPVLCNSSVNNECMTDPSNYVKTKASSGQTSPYADTSDYGGVIGLAKDGHIIVGPYNKSGTSWGCDEHDICNGTFLDGQYVYVSTGTFPYVVGCWGPATA